MDDFTPVGAGLPDVTTAADLDLGFGSLINSTSRAEAAPLTAAVYRGGASPTTESVAPQASAANGGDIAYAPVPLGGETVISLDGRELARSILPHLSRLQALEIEDAGRLGQGIL